MSSRALNGRFVVYWLSSVFVLCVKAASFNKGYLQGLITNQDVSTPLPKFLSNSHTYRVIIGESVTLPCEVEHLGSSVLLWRRGSAVLSAANLMVTRDKRFQLVDGYNLRLTDVRPQDAGDYVCQIGDHENKDQVHTLEILVPPSVKSVPSSGHLTARRGSTVTLECRASGNPVPNIHWSKLGTTTPSSQLIAEGPTIILEKLTRQQGGMYRCKADNGIGEAVASDIQVVVLSPPEITVAKSWIHAGEGYQAQLVCFVQGEAKSEVIWYQDSFLLGTSDRKTVESNGNRHTLTIRNIQNADFGNYSCVADNALGRARKYIELSGRPGPASFHSPVYSQAKDTYNLTWTIESHEPLEEVRLMYRKLMINETYQHPGRWQDVYLDSGWPADASFTHFMSYRINGLEQNSVYEAVIQARNRFGWNVVSDIYQFYTLGNEPLIEDMELKAASRAENNRGIWQSYIIYAMSLSTLVRSISFS